jgi:hypothetical protein
VDIFSQLLINIVKNVEPMPIAIHIDSVDVAVEIPDTCDVFLSIESAEYSLVLVSYVIYLRCPLPETLQVVSDFVLLITIDNIRIPV